MFKIIEEIEQETITGTELADREGLVEYRALGDVPIEVTTKYVYVYFDKSQLYLRTEVTVMLEVFGNVMESKPVDSIFQDFIGTYYSEFDEVKDQEWSE